jgi:hypothetical protein
MPDRRLVSVLFCLLVVTYAYVFPRWADPNQDSRLKMVVAAVDDGTFQIDKYLGTTVDYAKVGDHYYSDKAPGVAFLGIPVYAALRVAFNTPLMAKVTERLANSESFKATLRAEGSGVLEQKVRFALAQIAIALVVGVVPTAFTAALLYLWLARLTESVGVRLTVTLGYALLTPVFAYANAMYGHQLSAALLFGAFYLMAVAERPPRVPVLLGVGVLLAYAVVTEYPAALMTGILYLYSAYCLWRWGQWRSLVWVTASAAVIAAGWMLYNKAVFGGPLSLGYSYSEQWVTQHHTGFLSLTLPSMAALWGITFGLFRGLFVLAPWLLLAVPGFVIWWRSGQHRAEFFVALASVISIYLFNASSVMWWGGYAIGPRYILPMLPFLALATVYAFRAGKQWRWFIGLSVVLCAWSLVATWGLTLAEQAFPPDTLFNPLVQYALPNWQSGNIARNVGTLIGLRGAASVLPLMGLWLAAGGAWLLTHKRLTAE